MGKLLTFNFVRKARILSNNCWMSFCILSVAGYTNQFINFQIQLQNFAFVDKTIATVVVVVLVSFQLALNLVIWRDSGNEGLHLCDRLCIPGKQIKPLEQIQQLEDSASNQERSLIALNNIENIYTMATVIAYFYA